MKCHEITHEKHFMYIICCLMKVIMSYEKINAWWIESGVLWITGAGGLTSNNKWKVAKALVYLITLPWEIVFAHWKMYSHYYYYDTVVHMRRLPRPNGYMVKGRQSQSTNNMQVQSKGSICVALNVKIGMPHIGRWSQLTRLVHILVLAFAYVMSRTCIVSLSCDVVCVFI